MSYKFSLTPDEFHQALIRTQDIFVETRQKLQQHVRTTPEVEFEEPVGVARAELIDGLTELIDYAKSVDNRINRIARIASTEVEEVENLVKVMDNIAEYLADTLIDCSGFIERT